MLLSICLAVYNQIDIVKENIEEIIKTDNTEIEIVISDDCSKEPLYEMVQNFNDDRIKYYKTDKNRSHDENIINGLLNCKGDYIFLFRSKDKIIHKEINNVLDIIKKNPKASYFLFSALDEDGKPRLVLKDKVYHKNEEAQLTHGWLMVHPSGQIYKRSMLDIELYKQYIKNHFPKYNGCVVHQLIRMDLSLKGDFITSSCFAWEYMHTYKSDKESVISTAGKINIYAPFYQYQRYKCEWDFVVNEVPEKYKKVYIKQIIRDYIWRIVPMFYLLNLDKDCNMHYNSEPMDFKPYKELWAFNKMTLKMIENMNYQYKGGVREYLAFRTAITGFYFIPKAICKNFIYSHDVLKKFWFRIRKNRQTKHGLIS